MNQLQQPYHKIGRYCYNKDTISKILETNNGVFIDPFTRNVYDVKFTHKVAKLLGIKWKSNWETVPEGIYIYPRTTFALVQLLIGMYAIDDYTIPYFSQIININLYLLFSTVVANNLNLIGDGGNSVMFTIMAVLQMTYLNEQYPDFFDNITDIIDGLEAIGQIIELTPDILPD